MTLHILSLGGCDTLIGDILKRTRTIYGYKASEMSEMLQISKSYLSEIEKELTTEAKLLMDMKNEYKDNHPLD